MIARKAKGNLNKESKVSKEVGFFFGNGSWSEVELRVTENTYYPQEEEAT